MTNYWQEIIKQQVGLIISNNATATNQYIPLPQLSVLNISGEEAAVFLQNLLTNDVNALALNQSQLSGFCNAKGRLFSIFRLIRREKCYQLVLPQSICPILQQRLSMFILRSKVTITDISDRVNCMGLLTLANSEFDELELADEFVSQYDLNEITYHFAIIPDSDIDEVVSRLQTRDWKLGPIDIWEQGEIKAGIPSIYPETKEKFTPQQVNLDLVNGVSFNKGCYPGQEVVARLHYLGKPSRRMFTAEAVVDAAPVAGEIITNQAGDVAGHIVRSQMSKQNIARFLVSLKISEQDTPLFISETVKVSLLRK